LRSVIEQFEELRLEPRRESDRSLAVDGGTRGSAAYRYRHPIDEDPPDPGPGSAATADQGIAGCFEFGATRADAVRGHA
jgi:hypothetical protein